MHWQPACIAACYPIARHRCCNGWSPPGAASAEHNLFIHSLLLPLHCVGAAGAVTKPAILHHKAAAKAAPLPASAAKAAKGCWLDAMRSRAAPKRKAAAAPAGEAANSKRAATDAAAAGQAGEAGAADDAKPAAGHGVLYVYNEGYTNAVKRPMKVHELLD
jgi:hypothetical protein